MVRRVDVNCPTGKIADVVDVLEGLRFCHDLTIHTGTSALGGKNESYGTISFKCVDKKTSTVVSELDKLGVGSVHGSVDITALESTKPMISSRLDIYGNEIPKQMTSLRDRRTVGEIFHSIDSQCHMTFDYLVMSASASMICVCGLLDDNVTLVVASMLVSPLMGPILALVYGTMMKDNRMIWKGFRTEVSGIAVIWLVGFIGGLIVFPWDENSMDSWLVNIDQLNRRGQELGLVVGVMVAIPSGVALAIAITSDVIAPFVGVAISAALLPPICASGLAAMLGIIAYSDHGLTDHSAVHLKTAWIAMLLFIINWVLIYIFGLLTFYIKQVMPSHASPDPRLLNEPINAIKRKVPLKLKDASVQDRLLGKQADKYETFNDEEELGSKVSHTGKGGKSSAGWVAKKDSEVPLLGEQKANP